MTTAGRPPHPWSLNGAAELANLDPGGGRRPPRQVSQENAAATRTRMLLDDHRSDGVRCGTAWPCTIAADALYRTAS
ncbi:hypothetical protein ACH4E7_13480 [Kitasatospora sp. NPDC018058]|uniref:hypothetical protein n=1 Tax=Kitasatospora sp. NPDC018058 TaxID=3364025 RepID=UPI0037BF0739